MQQLPTFCGKDCGGDACPLLAHLVDGRVTRISFNPAGGPYLRGCRRGLDLPLFQSAPDRILTPLVRTGRRGSGQFRPAAWEEALDLAAAGLSWVLEKNGAGSILGLGSAGSTGALYNTHVLSDRFLNLLGGGVRLTGGYSNGAARFVSPYLLGPVHAAQAGFDPSTLPYASLIILWGANILDTRMGSELPARLLEAKKRRIPIIAIDPRRTATVTRASTWHIPIRPGSDAALMLSVLHVLSVESRLDREFIAAHSVGFAQLERYVLGQGGAPACTPAWAAEQCGVPAEDIVKLARAYADAKPAMLLPGYSIQRVFAGEESYRLTVALQVATGNFGLRGGSTGAVNSRLPGPQTGKLTAPPAPHQPLVPSSRWPDAVLEGRSGGYPTDIHAITNIGSNFVNQGPDARKNMAAFNKVDFSLTLDMFMTPTALWSDVILPAADPLEKEDLGLPWLGSYILYKPQVVPPRGLARNDYDILCDLSQRLGTGEAFSEGRSAHDWIELFLQQSAIPDLDEFRRTGVYMAPDQERPGLADFRADPAGHPLDTPSGLVEIASEAYARATGLPAIPTWQAPPEDPRYPLRLISPKTAYMTHSQGSSIPAIRRRLNHGLEMHARDAAARGLAAGDTARLFNDRGVCLVPVQLSEKIMPGVVSLPEGIWPELDADGRDHAGSANILTDSAGTRASKAVIMHAIGVEVEKADRLDAPG